jgi:hypothetical protein
MSISFPHRQCTFFRLVRGSVCAMLTGDFSTYPSIVTPPRWSYLLSESYVISPLSFHLSVSRLNIHSTSHHVVVATMLPSRAEHRERQCGTGYNFEYKSERLAWCETRLVKSASSSVLYIYGCWRTARGIGGWPGARSRNDFYGQRRNEFS